MHTSSLSAAIACCLLGCSTPEQRAVQQQAEMGRMMAEFGPACAQLGYAPESDPWRQCVLQRATASDYQGGGVSTSIFGSWGRWGRGSGAGVGAGVTLGR